jgi:hypothetical protein
MSAKEDFDRVCSECNVRNGMHGNYNGSCPTKEGRLPAPGKEKTFFVDSGKSRTQKCDKNKNPRMYK